MSDSNRPVRRRRIAGEAGPAAPAKKAASKKASTAKNIAAKKGAPAAKKAPLVNKAVPANISTAVTSTPSSTESTSRTSTTKPIPARVPTRKPASPDAAPVKRPAGSRPSRRDLLWLVPSTLIAAAILALGIFWVVNPPGADDSGSALDTSRRQASSAAASATETIFSFRYDQLDQHLTASKALMTSGFAKEFDSIAPALTELAPQRNVVVQAVARESAALPCGDECSSTRADVLVFVDQARLIGDSTEPTVFANRVKVTMVKDDDGWLVADIRAL